MTEFVLKPGSASLADWRAIYRGATPVLDPACKPLVSRSAQAVARIVARGEPVYGINTGFGKLASVRIDAADLETLQRNIILAHCRRRRRAAAGRRRAADDGAEDRQPGAGRLRRAAGDAGTAGSHARQGRHPGHPEQGSVGASGDLAPLAHMTAAMIGVGECFHPSRPHAGGGGVRGRRPRAGHARRQGRAGAAQRHAVLDRLCAGRACSRQRCCSARR